MGNRNNTQRHSTKKNTASPQSRDRSDQQQVIDLDEIVEKWARLMWNRTKTRSLSCYKPEELLIAINWKRVTFIQTAVNFYGSPPLRLPKSQILFRTSYDNKTANEQSYVLKAERCTRSTFGFTFTKCLRKLQESCLIFRLPEEIIESSGGIKHEQSVEFGQNTMKEYDTRWTVDTQIRVAPFTRTLAELNIDEEEFHGDFGVSIRFFGRITATIATRQSPNTFLKFIDGDIVQIIRETLEDSNQSNGLEIFEEYLPAVQFTMYGKYFFRYGVQQHIVLNQESITEQSISSIPTQNYYTSSFSSTYRPLRTQLTRSNNTINLKIDDDEHYEIL